MRLTRRERRWRSLPRVPDRGGWPWSPANSTRSSPRCPRRQGSLRAPPLARRQHPHHGDGDRTQQWEPHERPHRDGEVSPDGCGALGDAPRVPPSAAPALQTSFGPPSRPRGLSFATPRARRRAPASPRAARHGTARSSRRPPDCPLPRRRRRRAGRRAVRRARLDHIRMHVLCRGGHRTGDQVLERRERICLRIRPPRRQAGAARRSGPRTAPCCDPPSGCASPESPAGSGSAHRHGPRGCSRPTQRSSSAA